MNHSESRCDLHTHTTASDGMNKPGQNVRLAQEKGLAALAITDHDTVAGVLEAIETGKEIGIFVAPGVEISTRANDHDIHVLGYFIDIQDQVFLKRLEELRLTRSHRNEAILENLNKLGISITMDEVIEGLGRPMQEGGSVGRPHIADVLVRKGYVRDMRDAFDRYLAEGAPAYASLPRISPAEAVKWIREAGGAPVLAHPGIYHDDPLVQELLKELPFAGIEVYHSEHDSEDESRYLELATRYQLIPTGGSDYHGERQGTVFHGDLGSRTVPVQTLEMLRERAENNCK